MSGDASIAFVYELRERFINETGYDPMDAIDEYVEWLEELLYDQS